VTRGQQGFSLLELLVVIAVLGVLLGIGFVNLPRDRFAVNQAAEGLARDVQLARFEAIRRNTFVVLQIDADNNRYQIVERDGGAVFKRVELGSSSTPQARIASVDAPANNLVFDPRGIGIGLGPQAVVIGSTATDYSKTVRLSQQGRASIE
jgi:type II secretion system protein H